MIEYNNFGFLDGYEDWNIRELNSKFFCIRNSKQSFERLSSSFFLWYGKGVHRIRAVSNNRIYDQLTGYHDLNSVKWYAPFKDMIHIPQEGESLYFAPGCKFPRSRIKRNFKWTPSPIGADVVVLPTIRHVNYHPNMGIFFLDRSREIFMLSLNSYDLAQDPPKIGQTIAEYIEHRGDKISLQNLKEYDNEVELDRIGDAVCRSISNVVDYDKIMEPVIDAIEGIYTSVIFEEDLLESVNIDHQEDITSDLIEPLYAQINSVDSPTRSMALKALAALDYKTKPSVARYLLRHVYNWKNEAYCSVGVEFMHKSLGIELRNTCTIEDSEVFGHINSNEFPIMKEILEKECQEAIHDAVLRFQQIANVKITVNCDVTVEE